MDILKRKPKKKNKKKTKIDEIPQEQFEFEEYAHDNFPAEDSKDEFPVEDFPAGERESFPIVEEFLPFDEDFIPIEEELAIQDEIIDDLRDESGEKTNVLQSLIEEKEAGKEHVEYLWWILEGVCTENERLKEEKGMLMGNPISFLFANEKKGKDIFKSGKKKIKKGFF